MHEIRITQLEIKNGNLIIKEVRKLNDGRIGPKVTINEKFAITLKQTDIELNLDNIL